MQYKTMRCKEVVPLLMDVPLEIKSVNADGSFAGYASVFDIVDNQRDVVERGAFIESIRGRLQEIKLLWHHAMDTPIGYFTAMFEDANGLYVEGKLMLELERAREAYALLREGVVSGLSIGYSPVRYDVDPETGVRRLKQVALWEVSLVTFPANEASRVSVVKSANGGAIEELSRALRRVEELLVASSL